MGFLEKGWKLVENLFYEEKAAITAAKYYLYLYFVESLQLEELKIDLLDLEKRLFDASYAFLVWFISSLIGTSIEHYYELDAFFVARDYVKGKNVILKLESILESLDKVLNDWSSPLVEDLKPWIKYQALSAEFWSSKPANMEWIDAVKVDIKILDAEFPAIESAASAFSRILSHRGLMQEIEIDFNMSKVAVELLANYDEYSIRVFVDTFFAMEHCSGQLLIHVVVTECTDAAWNLYSILEYAREGNVYAIYDFLRKKNVKLPAIVRRYANMLPGTEYRQMQF